MKIIINDLVDIIKPFNQLLYQILILITLYFLFNNITNSHLLQLNNKHIKYYNHKQFIMLYILLIVFIDWFMWLNTTRTILFISIIIIYSYYNFNNIKLITLFINTTNSNTIDLEKYNSSNSSNSNCYDEKPIPRPLQSIKNITKHNITNKNIKNVNLDNDNDNNNNNNNNNNSNNNNNNNNNNYMLCDSDNNFDTPYINTDIDTAHNTYIADSHYAEILYNTCFDNV